MIINKILAGLYGKKAAYRLSDSVLNNDVRQYFLVHNKNYRDVMEELRKNMSEEHLKELDISNFEFNKYVVSKASNKNIAEWEAMTSNQLDNANLRLEDIKAAFKNFDIPGIKKDINGNVIDLNNWHYISDKFEAVKTQKVELQSVCLERQKAFIESHQSLLNLKGFRDRVSQQLLTLFVLVQKF